MEDMKKMLTVLASVATLFLAAPAFACGGYGEQEAVTWVVLSDARAHQRPNASVEDLVVNGDHAEAVVAWGQGDRQLEQALTLARRDGAWSIVSVTYVVPRGTFARIAEAHRR
jgi:hypothetical protein